jgi:hypothetical protein
MTTTLTDRESAVETASPHSDELPVDSQPDTASPPTETLPSIDSEEYRLLYLPTMVAVYTARHQQMPESEAWLHRHVFGFGGHPGCEACREETEFLVAHQKKFF